MNFSISDFVVMAQFIGFWVFEMQRQAIITPLVLTIVRQQDMACLKIKTNRFHLSLSLDYFDEWLHYIGPNILEYKTH